MFFFSCKVFQSQLVTWGEFIQDSQIFLPSNLTCICLVKIVGAIPGSSICVSNLCPNSPRKTLPLKAGTFYIGRIISFRFLHSLTPLTPSLPPSLFRQLVGPLGRPRYPIHVAKSSGHTCHVASWFCEFFFFFGVPCDGFPWVPLVGIFT